MDWKSRCEITDDVVFFKYVPEGLEKNVDEVFVWDLDKTYLDTSIDSIQGLLLTAVERALAKKNVPGTNVLLQQLAKTWIQAKGQSRFPIYFITASPPQMETRIDEKFALDGIRPFGCFYKDNLQNLYPRRWWRLTKQVGYKVQALLQLRLRLKAEVKQIFWGDDSESDALIYNLYSDICARRLSPLEIRNVLRHFFVTGEQADRILDLQMRIPEVDPVEKIYINLAADTDPDWYLKFGRRTLPTYNYFQVAVDLCQDQRLPIQAVIAVAQDMIFNYSFTPEELVRAFDELVRRRVLGQQCFDRLVPVLMEHGIMPAFYKPGLAPGRETRVEQGKVYDLEGHFEPWVAQRIDYLHDYR
ncbi:MAG: hypothetical protein C5B49_13850 [Bdellovibrio sp.]|nr:MAG: hypothetical protein C5B49_13850 [Bdellovibrio sp.]